jgi:hypothetical protein
MLVNIVESHVENVVWCEYYVQNGILPSFGYNKQFIKPYWLNVDVS